MGIKRVKFWQNERLVFYAEKANPSYWDNHWKNQISRSYYENYENGCLDELAPYIRKYLKIEDKILEAGCGPAKFVVSLLSLGYENVEGIDTGQGTIDQVKSIFPDLPIGVGDVLQINKPDNYYDAYISVGVVEHRAEGPEPFFHEARRVLNTGGYAFISVPYVNPLRMLKKHLGYYHKPVPGGSIFYQYAFQKSEFAKLLEENGFKILDHIGFAGMFALREELPRLFYLLDRLPGGYRLIRFLKDKPLVDYFGHMILFVCKK